MRADQAIERNDLQGAVKELQGAVRLDESDAEAHGRLGLVFRRMGRFPDAASSLARAIKLRPDPRFKVLLAFTYQDLGQYGKAVPLLSETFGAEQKVPIKLVIGQRLVECNLAIGFADEALPTVQTLRQIAPEDPNVLYLASKVYMSLWNGAFQTLLTKAPNSYQVRLIQAEALEAQGRFGEAVHEYRGVMQAEPRLHEIRYRLGRALLLSQPDGKADTEAQAEFEKVLEGSPLHVEALTEIGEIHLRGGRREEALRWFAEAFRVRPAAVPPRVGLAKALIAEKQWAKALEQLEPAVKAAPNDPSIHYNLMLAYRGSGRAAEAKQALETFERLKKDKNRQ